MKLRNKIRIPKLKKRTTFILVILEMFILFSIMSPVNALFVSLFIIFLSFRIDIKILGAACILLLVSIPVLQYFERTEEAEQMAVYVYFLLVIIVIINIIDSRRRSSAVDRSTLVESESQKSAGLNVNTGTDADLAVKTQLPIPRRLGSIPTKVAKVERDTTHVDWSQVTEDEGEVRAQALAKKEIRYVEPSYRRDLRKDEQTPGHRLAYPITKNEHESLPLHLTLPERLKLLSEQQRRDLHSTKPSLDGLKPKRKVS